MLVAGFSKLSVVCVCVCVCARALAFRRGVESTENCGNRGMRNHWPDQNMGRTREPAKMTELAILLFLARVYIPRSPPPTKTPSRPIQSL